MRKARAKRMKRPGTRWRVSGAVSRWFPILATARSHGVLHRAGAHRIPGFLPGMLYVIATVYGITNVMVIWEAVSALRAVPTASRPAARERAADVQRHHRSVSAQRTAHHRANGRAYAGSTIDLPADRFEVVLAYNTPYDLPVEDRLRALAARDPRLEGAVRRGQPQQGGERERGADDGAGRDPGRL